MPLYTELPGEIEEVDVIIAGGGTAACVIASRLSDADTDLSILVVEGGPNNYNEPSIIYPLLWFDVLQPGCKNALFYKTNESKHVADRELVVASGGCLGGGSSVNLLLYARAQRSDFDSWQTLGWSADEMLPYLRKLETYHGPGAKEHHGYDGPIQVSRGTYHPARPENDFIQAASKVGVPEIEDAQNLEVNIGVQRALHFVSPDGRRQDTAHAYLHPRLQDGKHPNLHVVVESKVVRAVLDDKKAVGVEYKPRSGAGTPRTIRARKMVVVSCGACGSPGVLERSGVGDAEVLKGANVKVVVDNPGVGADYQDHHVVLASYKSSMTPEESADGVASGRLSISELIQNSDEILGWSVNDIVAQLRPTDDEAASMGPKFEEAWKRDYQPVPDRMLTRSQLFNILPIDQSLVPAAQYYAVSIFNVYPYSRGHIHITGSSLDDPLDFESGFFTDEHDLDIKKVMWGYKKQREIMRRMDTYRGELSLLHPPFPETSGAAITSTDAPLKDVKDIEYSAEDDAILEQWVRETVGTTWHSLGTCRMGLREQKGVVDASLSVYGIEGLKVADMSIVPKNVGANTGNTAIAVGEKAADIFIKELGLVKA